MSEVAIRPARVELSAGDLLTVMHEGQECIVIRPAVESLGLSHAAQYRKLKSRSWATVAQKAMVAADGKVRVMDVVPVQTFLMLLATVDENRVAEHARPTLIAYQRETAQAIHDYWTKGQAVNSRSGAVEPSNFVVPSSFPEALRLAADEHERAEGLKAELEQKDAVVQKLTPKAEMADVITSSEGISLSRFHNCYFVGVGYRDFFEHLYAAGYCRDERGKRWSESKQQWADGFEHRHPKAKGRPFLYVTGGFIDNEGRRQQHVRVRPGESELDFVRALVRDGLPLNPAKTIPGLPELRRTPEPKAIEAPQERSEPADVVPLDLRVRIETLRLKLQRGA